MPASSKTKMKKIFLLLKVGKLSCYSNQKSEKKRKQIQWIKIQILHNKDLTTNIGIMVEIW